MASRFMNILVLGNRENVKLYDTDYQDGGEKVVKMFYEDAEKERRKLMNALLFARKRLQDSKIFDYQDINVALAEIGEMSEMGFLVNFNPDCEFDDHCNAIYKSVDKPKYYSHAKCYDEKLRYFKEEAPMTTPFRLLDGKSTYVARKGEIDWAYMHGRNKELYGRVWDMCVEGSEPANDEERGIFENMGNRISYFENFKDKDDYVSVSTSFWCHAVIDETGEIHMIDTENSENAHEWASNFYKDFVEPLDDYVEMSLYEAKIAIQ